MWFNGFITVIDMALGKVRSALLDGHREALILGSFREDVCFVGGIDAVFQSPSLSHFSRARVPGGFVPWLWSDAAERSERLALRACGEYAAGRVAAAMVQLGRAVHPLVDMSCPVHAQGIAHANDPFEWCVEAMSERLRALPVADVPPAARFGDPTRAMARHAQSFAADGTNSPWGRLLERAGRRKPVNHTLARAQAMQLIPVAAGHTAALFEVFLARCSAPEPAAVGPALPATLRALEMSEAGRLRWFAQLTRFCAQHGGRRYYAGLLELLDLLDRCPAGQAIAGRRMQQSTSGT